MKVSFSPVISNKMYSFKAAQNTDYAVETQKEPDKQKIVEAKVKKVISECSVLAIAAGILYFGVKVSFANQETKEAARKLDKIRRMIPPESRLPMLK